MKFTFNKKARAVALNAIKKLEGGAFVSAVLGAYSADPKVSAISAAVLFLICRVCETVIAGIEDDADDGHRSPRKSKAKETDEDSPDSG
jgi:hypothetical protein